MPHTWQTAADTAEFLAPGERRDCCVRVEFEGVFHSAVVTVNERPAGQHLRKAYTAFTIDLTPHLRWGEMNRPAARPGFKRQIQFKETSITGIQVDVLRPTGFSVSTEQWRF